MWVSWKLESWMEIEKISTKERREERAKRFGCDESEHCNWRCTWWEGSRGGKKQKVKRVTHCWPFWRNIFVLGGTKCGKKLRRNYPTERVGYWGQIFWIKGRRTDTNSSRVWSDGNIQERQQQNKDHLCTIIKARVSHSIHAVNLLQLLYLSLSNLKIWIWQ